MKITILANCSRCGEQFVLQAKEGDQILRAVDKGKVAFALGDKLVRHRYVRGMHFDDNVYFHIDESEIVSFCQACDAAYWDNFHSAVAKLEAFWHDPIGEGGQE